MIGLLSPLADAGISYKFGYVFAGCNFLAALLVWFFLYESRTLSLENVDLMYGEPDVKPWSSSKWVPPGYITRRERDETHFRQRSIAHSGPGGPGEKRHSASGSGSGEEPTTAHV